MTSTLSPYRHPATPNLPELIVGAQREVLSRDDRLATLNLDPVHRKAPGLDVAQAIVSARVTLTIDGPCFLEIVLQDEDWLIERSGITDTNPDGRLDDNIVVSIDGLRFRLTKARRTGRTIALTFTDEVKVLLDRHSKPTRSTRGSVTRAQFVENMVFEVKDRHIWFVSPEINKRQPVARPDLPHTRPHGTTGFDQGTTFKVKGHKADAHQMREAATLLGVADQEDVIKRVRLALLVAAIGESTMGAQMMNESSGYGGVLGGDVSANYHYFKKNDTEGMARCFLKGGKGYQGGGAIALAREHPDWSPGKIALVVLGSASNFGTEADGINHYQFWIKEARKIADLWQSGTGDATHEVLTFKAYEFERGLPGRRETSWQAADRLAREVNWRFFSVGGVVCFVSDFYLITQPAALTIDPMVDGEFGLPDGLLRMPDYDHDEGKTATEVELDVVASRWGVLPGEVVVLNNMGSVSGRRIVETFEFDVLSPIGATVTLTRPLTPRKEPAPEAITTEAGESADVGAGAQAAIAWAKSKRGHYKEEFGSNLGAELNELERQFGLKGAPWCAMFATTALVHGGVTRDCRTASVHDINRWAAAGTHGYLGFRATPQPGDLMTFGDDHVAFVWKVHHDSVDTIEGNTSAGQVSTSTRVRNSGRFVRPDYRA